MINDATLKTKFQYTIWDGSNIDDIKNLLPSDAYKISKNMGFKSDYTLSIPMIDTNGCTQWHDIPLYTYIVYDKLTDIPLLYDNKQQFKKHFLMR